MKQITNIKFSEKVHLQCHKILQLIHKGRLIDLTLIQVNQMIYLVKIVRNLKSNKIINNNNLRNKLVLVQFSLQKASLEYLH